MSDADPASRPPSPADRSSATPCVPRAPSRGRRLRDAIGPGILFAAAAIGVSHLNQSTRAGAVYGLAFVGVILLAHLAKVPAMLAGPRYAAATGTSLLQAYRRQGRHATIAFALVTFGTMFTIQAAVTIVTAAILRFVVVEPVLGPGVPVWAVAAGVLALGTGMLAAGGYRWLDRVMKVLMLVMAASTVLVAAIELPSLEWGTLRAFPPVPEDPAARLALVAFAVALVGWMPAPLDISVWHSLWTIARRRQTSHAPSRRECELDFAVGYALCALLAVAFVVLGAAELHAKGIEPAAGAGPFGAQLVDLYTAALGPWARPVIGTCAVAVMLSTTLTVLDALPRTAVQVLARLRTDERYEDGRLDVSRTRGYWVLLGVIVAGAMTIITAVGGRGFQTLIDLATTLSFLGTPVIAWFNHRAMTGPELPENARPGLVYRAASLACIVLWTAFAGVFLWQRFGSG